MACCGVDSQWTSAAVFGKCAGTVSVRDDFDARAPRPVSTAGQPVTIPPHTFLGRLRSFTIGLGVTVAGGWTVPAAAHHRRPVRREVEAGVSDSVVPRSGPQSG